MSRIPQFDGAASTSSNSSNTPPPGAGLPGSSQPRATGASEEINSDLDDSESEGEGAEETETGGPDQDIVFCTYDKVRISSSYPTEEVVSHFTCLGCKGKKQVEMRFKRWNGSYQRERLPVCKVYRVRE